MLYFLNGAHAIIHFSRGSHSVAYHGMIHACEDGKEFISDSNSWLIVIVSTTAHVYTTKKPTLWKSPSYQAPLAITSRSQ